MKNLIRIPLIMAISVLCCRSGRAQEFYRGEMFVTGQQFSLADGRLNIDLSVDFEGLRMPSDESLTVTPVLISGENEQALPAVLINGTEKQKVYQRQQEFTGNGHPSPIPAVVIKNDARMARSFRYRVAVPYQEWMKDALLLIRSQECACHGRQGSIYEDKIADRLNLPKVRTSVWDTDTDRKYLTWVNFIEPAPDKDTLHAVTGSIPYFGKEQRDKRERPLGELSDNQAELRDIPPDAQCLAGHTPGGGNEAHESEDYRVRGPRNLQKNEVDALVRSLKLKDYLRENRLTAGTPLEVTWISEDWDSIAALVKQSDMMFREATLDLIGNVDIDKGRERMLMHLADGKPYKYLAEKIFPEVMRVDYRIEYTRQPLDAAESLRLFRTGERRALRLNEFFTVAGTYPQGSTEYNDVLDLAARLFPDSPEANINAAAVALTKGETAKARRYRGEVCHPAHGIQQHGHTLPAGRKPGQGGGIPHHGCGSRGETSRQSA